MFKRIQNSSYYLLFIIHTDKYELFITDYISIWNAIFTTKSFTAQLLQSNEGLELDNNNEFIQKGIHLLTNVDMLKKHTILKENDAKQISVELSISIGYVFYFKCKLYKGPEELFFQKVTQPLLRTISDLRNSQQELRHLLLKKDKEIDEYKSEGGEIVLRHLKTVAFDDEEHMKKHETYEETFGSVGIPSILLEQTVTIQQHSETQTRIVKEEPNLKYNSHLPKILEEAVSSTSKEDLSVAVNCKQEVLVEPKENRRKRLKKLNY